MLAPFAQRPALLGLRFGDRRLSLRVGASVRRTKEDTLHYAIQCLNLLRTWTVGLRRQSSLTQHHQNCMINTVGSKMDIGGDVLITVMLRKYMPLRWLTAKKVHSGHSSMHYSSYSVAFAHAENYRSLVFAHNCIDGRNTFAMLDKFLNLLSAEIAGTLPSSDVGQWGEETARLPPPGAFIPFLAESGTPPSLEAPPPTPAPEPSASGEAPSPPVCCMLL